MHQTFPRMFGKYILEGELARGGMAAVFKATLRGAEGFEKRLVVKQILPEFARDGELIQRFIAEAKLLVELNHPNIVRVFELGVERGTYFIAMEYVDGRSLHDLFDGPPFSSSEVVLIGASIAKALAYAHKRGSIVHRDLTPRNVLIDREGHVFLIDFGLASRVASTDALDYGTEGYAAPEQITGDRGHVEPSADIYSLGKILERLVRCSTPSDGLAQISKLALQATKIDPRERMDASSIEKALRQLATEGGAEERLAERVETATSHRSGADGSDIAPRSDEPIPSQELPYHPDPKTASFAKRAVELHRAPALEEPSTRKLAGASDEALKDETSNSQRPHEEPPKEAASSRSARSIFLTMGLFAVLLPLVPIGFVLSGATRSDAGVDPFVRGSTTLGLASVEPLQGTPRSDDASSPSTGATGTLTIGSGTPSSSNAPLVPSSASMHPSASTHPATSLPAPTPPPGSAPSRSSAPSATTSAQPTVNPIDMHASYTDLFGEPGTRFRIDGIPLGNAPVRRHALPPGSHRVEATFDPTGESLSESITVHPEEIIRIIAKFRSPVPTLTIERQ